MPDLDITHPAITAYLEETLKEDDPILREMGDYGRSHGFPIIGAQAGRLLAWLARAINARKVLELGSGYGYSAMWFARAMGNADGASLPYDDAPKVVMTEGNPDNVAIAREYFTRAGLLERVEFNVGDALQIAQRYPGPFDIILCDIDKQDYPKALPLALERLRVGGILVYDNMLWHGRVLSDETDTTRGVLETTRLLMNSPNLLTTLVPVRDGMTLSLRVK